MRWLLALLFAAPALAEPYAMLTAGYSANLGYDAPQSGIELGAPLTITDYVEVWVKAGASTAPKIEQHGRNLYGELAAEIRATPRLSIVPGFRYAETRAGYRKRARSLGLEIKWTWTDASFAVYGWSPDGTENEAHAAGLRWTANGKRLLFRLALESTWYLQQGRREQGLRLLLGFGVYLAPRGSGSSWAAGSWDGSSAPTSSGPGGS